MDFSNKTFQIVAKTSFGLEDVLVKELEQLGITDVEKRTRAVSFYGDQPTLYQTNLWLRTANRLLVPIRQFRIRNAEELYQKVKQISWEGIFNIDQTFSIDSTVFSPLFNHTKFAAFKAKDAVVDRFRDKFNERPNVDTDAPDIKINLHINQNNECTVSLDSSGTPLFKRGYRKSTGFAPIKEDLAAGMVLLSEWDQQSDFVDLFCGSGTIVIEAALIAYNIAPGINRDFGFFNWNDFNQSLFDRLKAEALSNQKKFTHKIMGADIDKKVIEAAKTNAQAAGLDDKVQLSVNDFKNFIPAAANGVAISNPPYGERIGEEINTLYKSYGDALKAHFNGWSAWIISSNLDALKKVGLRPSRKIKLFNGSLECRMMQYKMYQGTKKIHKLQKHSNNNNRTSS